MSQNELTPQYEVLFWVNENGKKPVAEWMKSLPVLDKKYLGGTVARPGLRWTNGKAKVL
ncbi:MAG: hypothetical protein ACOH5I_01610 [Oligoflexus sp.]